MRYNALLYCCKRFSRTDDFTSIEIIAVSELRSRQGENMTRKLICLITQVAPSDDYFNRRLYLCNTV